VQVTPLLAETFGWPTVLAGLAIGPAAGILAMVLWLVWLLPPESATGTLADALVAARWLAFGSVIAFVLIVVMSSRGAHSLVRAALQPIPSKAVRDRLLVLFEQLVEGMASVGHPFRFLQALVLTLAVWGAWLVGLVCTLWAFGLDLPLAAALFLEAALTLSMMVPQAPGFLGVFQVVTEEVLGLWNAPAAQAEGVALVFWTVCFVPITILGLIEGGRHGLRGGGDDE